MNEALKTPKQRRSYTRPSTFHQSTREAGKYEVSTNHKKRFSTGSIMTKDFGIGGTVIFQSPTPNEARSIAVARIKFAKLQASKREAMLVEVKVVCRWRTN